MLLMNSMEISLRVIYVAHVITKTNNREIKLIKMEFENLFSYGKKSTVEFGNMNGIITIIGEADWITPKQNGLP